MIITNSITYYSTQNHRITCYKSSKTDLIKDNLKIQSNQIIKDFNATIFYFTRVYLVQILFS